MRAKFTRIVMFGLLSVFLAAVVAPVRASAQQYYYPNDGNYQYQRREYRRDRDREWREQQRRREREWRERHRDRDRDRGYYRDWR